jgi:CheY-like chemotaxis protein
MPTILVVDDEPAILDMLQDILQSEGYDVVAVPNGKQGLACLVQTRPDLILSDVMMPEMDGRAFCRALQADPAFSVIPVVLMSAAPAPDVEEDVKYAAFLSKPFDIDTLIRAIVAVLDTRADEHTA